MADTLTSGLADWLADLSAWSEQHPPWWSLTGCPCGPDHEQRRAELMARKEALLARCAAVIAGMGPASPPDPVPARGGEGSRPPTAPLTLHHQPPDGPSPYELSSDQVVTLASRLEAAADELHGRTVLADIDRKDLADDLAWFAHELLGAETSAVGAHR